MTYIPDFDERGEARAEAWAEELEFDGDTVLCVECRERVVVADTLPSSPDPYSPPICNGCVDKIMAARGMSLGAPPNPNESERRDV